ncbi:MAG: BTAD domain-containing putative transcriptional regulator [Caldilineaceae bacterium]
MSIRTFGALSIALGNKPEPLRFSAHTVEALLVYLALQDRPLGRDELAELLWPERTQAQARVNLRGAIYRLRGQLEPYLLISRQNLALNPNAGIDLDARQFERHLAAGELATAVALYRGDFLAGFYLDGSPAFEQWALLERERLRNLVLSAYARLIDQSATAGQLDAAIAYAQRLLQLDALHEPTHRHLMRLLAQTGQRSAALAQFEICRKLLLSELGVPPVEETTALYEQIMQRRTGVTPHRTQSHPVTRRRLEGLVDTLSSFTTFGALLHYLRRSERMTQRELAIAVGYSESMISRLEHDERPPDTATIVALFVPALHLDGQSQAVAKLVKLADDARRKDTEDSQLLPAKSKSFFSLQHPIPVRLTSFVGRDDDVLAVARLLARARLVTLTGPGGCGKTSLAVETCRWLADQEGRGLADIGRAKKTDFETLALVELYPLSNASLIAQTVLVALGVESNYEQEPQQVLLNAIADRSVLLVLDNCEHFVDDVTRFVQVLLQRCPNLHIVATSRERLNIAAETTYSVTPLACPQQRPLPDLADIANSPAVHLFVERCQAIRPSMRLTPHNAAAVAQICTLLDGIPLALELAAAATATFSVQEIAERLGTGMLLASPGYRNAEPRHKSINDTVAWSYNLLAPTEQLLLGELSVFAGGWTLAALQQVCLDIQEPVIILHQLAQKSLVRVEYAEPGAGTTRYHLLRAVREYAAERLAATGDEEYVRRQHCVYFAQLGMALGDQVLGSQHGEAMARLDADYPNIRAALVFATSKPDLAEQRVRLAAALSYYWRRRGYVTEGLNWLHDAVADEGLLSIGARARVYVAVLLLRFDAPCRWHQGVHIHEDDLGVLPRADALIEPCLEQGDVHAAALLMFVVASLQYFPGSDAKAETYARHALSIFEQLGDTRGVGFACNLLTRILIAQGDVKAAQQVNSGIVGLLEQNRMTWALCESYQLQIEIAYANHDRAEIIRNLKRVAEIAEQEQFTQFLHDTFVALERIDRANALRLAEERLARQRQVGSSVMLALALSDMGCINLHMEQYESAACLLDEALQLWSRLGEVHGDGIGKRWTLTVRGLAARFLGDSELAVACFSESIQLFADDPGCTYPLLGRGQVRFELGELTGALEDYRTCLRSATGDPHFWHQLIVNCLAGIAEVTYLQGNVPTAASLCAQSDALGIDWIPRTASGNELATVQYQRMMAAAVQYRQDPIFEAAWQEGKALTLEATIELALAC